MTASGLAEAQDARLARRRAVGAVVRLDLRLTWTGASILVVVIGGITATVVAQYAVTFADPQAASGLALLAENPAIRVLFGAPRALDTAGGFTVWRIGMFTAVAAAVWGLLAATRLTRGEEDAGRTGLLLAGPLTLARLQAQRLTVLLVVQALLGTTIWVALLVTGASGPGAAVHGWGIGLVAIFYTLVGGLCGQLAGSRHAATEWAFVVFAAGVLLRMVGDARAEWEWLSWLSPFGLLSLSAPYADDRLLPLVVLAAAGIGVAAGGVALAGRRDVGAGVVPERRARTGSIWLLRSVAGFAVRRALPGLRGWGIGLGAYFALIGALSVSLTEFLVANPRFAELAAAAGFAELTTVQGYVAALLFLLPVPIGLFGALQLGLDAADEERGRLTLILTLPLARHHWALVRLAVVVAACCLLAVGTGFAVYLGASIAGAPLGLDEAVAGAVNALPAALLAVAAAQLALGWAPRAVAAVGATPVVGGFVLWTLAGTFAWPGWVAALSPFDHLTTVPATSPDWTGAVAMVLISIAWAGFGVLGYRRRDLRP